jgi:inositol hexakisphosphate/diphosphoinositol-pentakisphosphate kinase
MDPNLNDPDATVSSTGSGAASSTSPPSPPRDDPELAGSSIESSPAAAGTTESRPQSRQEGRGFHSHSLSSSSALSLHKAKHVEPGTTVAHAERADVSMPPPPLPAHISAKEDSTETAIPTTVDVSQHPQTSSHDQPSTSAVSPRDFAVAMTDPNDPDTSRLHAGTTIETASHRGLPDPSLRSARTSISEGPVSNRMSISSLYSLASARGVPSSAASAN